MTRAIFILSAIFFLACSSPERTSGAPAGIGGAGGEGGQGGAAGGVPVDAGMPRQCCPAPADGGAAKCCEQPGVLTCGDGTGFLCGVSP